MSEIPGALGPDGRPGQPTATDILRAWMSGGETSLPDSDKERIEWRASRLGDLRATMAHTDGLTYDLTDQAPRQVGTSAIGLPVSQPSDTIGNRPTEDIIDDTAMYRSGIDSDHLETYDVIGVEALLDLVDGDTNAQELIEGATLQAAGLRRGDEPTDDLVVSPDSFQRSLVGFLEQGEHTRGYSDARRSLIVDIVTISYVRNLMVRMHNRVVDQFTTGEPDGAIDAVAPRGLKPESLAAIAQECAGFGAGAGDLPSNEDAKWIVSKLVERGWVDIAGDLHNRAQAEPDPVTRYLFEQGKAAFMANIPDEMRSRVDSALFAEDLQSGPWRND